VPQVQHGIRDVVSPPVLDMVTDIGSFDTGFMDRCGKIWKERARQSKKVMGRGEWDSVKRDR
jgi:hypothetical protein